MARLARLHASQVGRKIPDAYPAVQPRVTREGGPRVARAAAWSNAPQAAS